MSIPSCCLELDRAAQELGGLARYPHRIAGCQVLGFPARSQEFRPALQIISQAFRNQPRLAENLDIGAKRLLEGLMTDAADPTAHALDEVKREAARLF